MLNRSAGISLDTFLPLITSSQKACDDTASPGNFMFMPMMAMGIVLSVAMAVVYGMPVQALETQICQRSETVPLCADASYFQKVVEEFLAQ